MSSYLDDEFAPLDAFEVVERHWPYDGPYGPEVTTAAATAIERLARYLNNATLKPEALPHAAVAGSVLASLHVAMAGMEQLAAQLARFAERQAADPTLYDDRGNRTGAVTALELAGELDELRPMVAGLAGALERAAGFASHIGNAEPSTPGGPPGGDGGDVR